jgi:hypothetical protein
VQSALQSSIITVKKQPRPAYRLQQFMLAFHPPAQAVETAQVSPYLAPAQLALFRHLQRSEQWHACLVLNKLLDQGESDRDLLAAALLHDLGKIHYPLHTWERVLIVLMKRSFPRLVQRWGQASPQGLVKPFAVACQHAKWGADLAEKAGASALTVELVRRHEEELPDEGNSAQDRLLRLLKQVDDSS